MSTDLDARTMRRFRRTLTAMLLTGSIAWLGGCDPASTTKVRNGLSDSSTSPQQLEAGPATPDEETLLSQAQQDVDFFLNQRNSADSNDPEESVHSDAGLSTDHHGDSTVVAAAGAAPIEWNDAGTGRSSVDSATGAAIRKLDPLNPSADGTSQAAAPNQHPVMNEPLYQDGPQRPMQTDAGVDPLRVNRVQQLVVDLSGALFRDAQRSDAPMRELMLVAATSLISPDRSINAQGIAALSESDRETLAAMQLFFSALGNRLQSAEPTDDVVRSALVELQKALDRRPPFGITTATLCTGVQGFGNFDEFEKLSFLAHRDQKVIVYVELENFSSELNDSQEWVTELAQELVIYSGRDGIAVWSEAWQSVVDVTRNKRQDFFTVQLVTLPEALSVGRYHLKVRIRDEATGAMAERSIPFEMVADPRMAAPVR